jgi:hypothetical protein
MKRPDTPEKLFTQVIEAAKPQILKLWEEGDRLISKGGPNCPQEILHDPKVGRSYYQCNPHVWQCYWQSGIVQNPTLEIDLFGQTFHIVAKATFEPIPAFSTNNRTYEMFKRSEPGLNVQYGYIIDVQIKEIPGLSQPMILTDSCRDTYLPQRIYAYGKVKDKRQEGFIWDNFDRHLFIDKFYVSNRQINEWRLLSNETAKVIADRKRWPEPALVNLKDQMAYCAFYGKRLLEAKLFDAATMSPADLKETMPEKVMRPQTPWQRDLSKSFLGMARINPDYQLTPLDCQLAQVQGCHERLFTTDSATWMGFNFALGFYPESFQNFIDPKLNFKKSSRYFAPASTLHELGTYAEWNGEQDTELPVAFRCYEEVTP